MKAVTIVGGILISCGIGCAAWGYRQTHEANDAEEAAASARAGQSSFENEPAIKQLLITTADRNARELRAEAVYWFIAAGCTVLCGIALCIAGARRPSRRLKVPDR